MRLRVLYVSDQSPCDLTFLGEKDQDSESLTLKNFLMTFEDTPPRTDTYDVIIVSVPSSATSLPLWALIRSVHHHLKSHGQLVLRGIEAFEPLGLADGDSFYDPWFHGIAIFRLLGWHVEMKSRPQMEGHQWVLSPKISPRGSLDVVSFEDMKEIARLFQKVFKSAIDPSMLAFKYASGRGHSILARSSEGDLLAHYGATSRRLSLKGKEALALQICDVMVDPVERGILGRHGLFFKVARAFQETYYGYSREFHLAYGFPNARAMRLAHKLGLYEKVDHLLEISWPLKRSLRSYCFQGQPLSLKTFSSNEMDTLWEKMRPGLKEYIAVIRDAAYLRYRYFDHPSFFYNALLIKHRMTGRVLGLVFLKEEEDHVKLMDVVGKIQDIQGLLVAARAFLTGSGSKPLKAWVTPRQWEVFKGPGATAVTTDIEIPTHTATPGIPVAELQGRWWVSFGDTDFL